MISVGGYGCYSDYQIIHLEVQIENDTTYLLFTTVFYSCDFL